MKNWPVSSKRESLTILTMSLNIGKTPGMKGLGGQEEGQMFLFR